MHAPHVAAEHLGNAPEMLIILCTSAPKERGAGRGGAGLAGGLVGGRAAKLDPNSCGRQEAAPRRSLSKQGS